MCIDAYFLNIYQIYVSILDHESLNLVLQSSDLVHQIGSLVGGDTGTDDSAGNTASTAQSSLAWNVHIWYVLVLTQKWEMEEDSKRSSVGCENDDLTDTTVQGLCGLVGTLLELAVVGCLLNNIKNLLGCANELADIQSSRQSLAALTESGIGYGPCGGSIGVFRHVVRIDLVCGWEVCM